MNECRERWGKGLSFVFLCFVQVTILRGTVIDPHDLWSLLLSTEFNLSRKLKAHIYFHVGHFEVSWYKGLLVKRSRAPNCLHGVCLIVVTRTSHGLKPSLDLLPLPSPVLSLFVYIYNIQQSVVGCRLDYFVWYLYVAYTTVFNLSRKLLPSCISHLQWFSGVNWVHQK